MKKKIFLSGSSGFIGKNILEKLGQKYNFFTPSHKQLDLLNFELVQKYFKKYGPFDAVLHTAIIGGNRKTGDSCINAYDSMRMFFNIILNEKLFRRFFFFGSGIEFGKEKPIKKFSEDAFGERIPKSNWGFFKYVCAKYSQSKNNFINLRLFGVFGKYEDYRIRFVSNAIYKNILNIPIVINQNIVMDYLFVEDLVRIVDRFLTGKSKYGVYNITPNESLDLVTIAKKINSIGINKVKINIRHKGFSNEYTGSNERLKREFGNLRFTPIDDSILELYQWYLERKDKINRKELENDYF